MVIALVMETIILVIILSFAIMKHFELRNKGIELSRLRERATIDQEQTDNSYYKQQGSIRKYHRVKLKTPIPCTIRFIDFGTDKLSQLEGKSINSSILDISLGGLRLLEEIELPVQYDVRGDIEFTFGEHSFNLPCEFLRKQVKIGSSKFTYGVRFLPLKPKEEHLLALSINQTESNKHRNLSSVLHTVK